MPKPVLNGNCDPGHLFAVMRLTARPGFICNK
jgi:hypothetical protein